MVFAFFCFLIFGSSIVSISAKKNENENKQSVEMEKKEELKPNLNVLKDRKRKSNYTVDFQCN